MCVIVLDTLKNYRGDWFCGWQHDHDELCCVHQAAVVFSAEVWDCVCVQREHNDLLLKLEFVRDLSASIIQIARSRSSPLAESVFVDDVAMCPTSTPTVCSDTCSSTVFISEGQRRLEQIVLYMRALELLASALNLAKAALADGRLSPTLLTRQGTSSHSRVRCLSAEV